MSTVVWAGAAIVSAATLVGALAWRLHRHIDVRRANDVARAAADRHFAAATIHSAITAGQPPIHSIPDDPPPAPDPPQTLEPAPPPQRTRCDREHAPGRTTLAIPGTIVLTLLALAAVAAITPDQRGLPPEPRPLPSLMPTDDHTTREGGTRSRTRRPEEPNRQPPHPRPSQSTPDPTPTDSATPTPTSPAAPSPGLPDCLPLLCDEDGRTTSPSPVAAYFPSHRSRPLHDHAVLVQFAISTRTCPAYPHRREHSAKNVFACRHTARLPQRVDVAGWIQQGP